MERLTAKSSTIIKNRLLILPSFFFLMAIAFSIPVSVYALEGLTLPAPGNIQILDTEEGSSFTGRIVEIGPEKIRFETNFGEITMDISKIKQIREVPETSVRDGKYWFPNPNTTRLFLAPTGRMLERGKGYVVDYYLFVPRVAYGITKNISISGGMTFIPFIGLSQMIYLMPEFGINFSDNFALSGGGLLVTPITGDYIFSLAGLAYGGFTFGKPDASLTAGVGYGLFDGELMGFPGFMFGGEVRVARGLSLVTENYIVPMNSSIVSYGCRFFWQRFSIDAAFVLPLGESNNYFPGLPFVSIAYNF